MREIIWRLRQSPFSAAIDYQGLWKSAMLPFFGATPKRIGFSSATIREFGVPLLYTDRVKTTKAHIADQNGDLSLRAGAQRGTAQANLQIPAQDQAAVCARLRAQGLDRYIVLSPGGGWRSKCWPPERFGALCSKLRESFGLRSIVNAGPGDDDLATAVVARSGDAARRTCHQLAELMACTRAACRCCATTAVAKSSSPGPAFTILRRPKDSRSLLHKAPKRSGGQHLERQPPPGLKTM